MLSFTQNTFSLADFKIIKKNTSKYVYSKNQNSSMATTLISARIGRPIGQYYPLSEDQLKITAFVLSCFVSECETGGQMIQEHH